MTSPPRPHRGRLAVVALSMVIAALVVPPRDARARSGGGLEAAVARLAVLEGRITLERRQVTDQLATIDAIRDGVDSTVLAFIDARSRYEAIRRAVDASVRGSSAQTDRTPRPAADARLATLEDMLRRQSRIVHALRVRLEHLRRELTERRRLLQDRRAVLFTLAVDQDRMAVTISKLGAQLDSDALSQARRVGEVGPIPPGLPGPFLVCPVDGPTAYGDSFGAPRYAGGYHPHAGSDILAPLGTPIRATFDGVASADPNGLGGSAVIVHGAEGWTYNAHLSSYGTLGSVSAGTIIGYVGNTGDAQGGPTHDHFEWHPDVIPADPYRSVYGDTVIGSAIDPFPYLNQVC